MDVCAICLLSGVSRPAVTWVPLGATQQAVCQGCSGATAPVWDMVPGPTKDRMVMTKNGQPIGPELYPSEAQTILHWLARAQPCA